MSELAEKIYTWFQSHPQYNFSRDLSVKALEDAAIKELVKKATSELLLGLSVIFVLKFFNFSS